jgi:transcriptional regulator with XRE-family HTH domain
MIYCSDFPNQMSSGDVRIFRNAKYRTFSYNLIVLDWYINEWLKATGTSQAELCRRTDYPKAKVSDLVNGHQRYNKDIINDVAAALNIQPFELLMHPADAMKQRRINKLAHEIVEVPVGGVAVDVDEPDEPEIRKSA